MGPGSVVVYLPDPWLHGIGTVRGVAKHAWLWVEFADGHFDKFDPHDLELADTWEHAEVERDLEAPA